MTQNIDKLNDRQFKALIGLNKERFNQLTLVFAEANLEIKKEYYQKFSEYYNRKPSAGGKPIFKLPAEKLFFILYYLKNYPTFDILGFSFNCSGKTAHQNLYKFLPILIMALDKLNCLPKRCFDSVEQFVAFTKEKEDLIIDATERIHHRKKDKMEQKEYYNGKKKHTRLKTL